MQVWYARKICFNNCLLCNQVNLAKTNITTTTCHCETQSTNFYAGTSLIIPPNRIDFVTVFANFSTLADNASVLAALIVTFLLYLLGLVWVRRQDIKDFYRVRVFSRVNSCLNKDMLFDWYKEKNWLTKRSWISKHCDSKGIFNYVCIYDENGNMLL